MEYVGSTSKIDPMKCFLHCISSTNRRGLTSRAGGRDDSQFWLHPKFKRWQSQQQPALIMVKGDYKSRLEVKRFCGNVVQMLRKNSIPVIWTLKTHQADGSHSIFVVDILRDLVHQALRLNVSLRTERSISLSCAQFRAAETEEQWLNLLAMIVATLPQLYIIVDIEAVDISSADKTHVFSWLSAFQAMFRSLSVRQVSLPLKVILVSYGSATVQDSSISEYRDLVVLARQLQATSVFQRGRKSGILRLSGTMPLARGSRTQTTTS